MEIKAVFNRVKKSFDQVILVIMVLIFLFSSLNYIKLIQKRDMPYDEKELCALANIPYRSKIEGSDEKAFEKMVDKKANYIRGIRPFISYQKLMHRNLFEPVKELAPPVLSIIPLPKRMNAGERSKLRALNGIGPYEWKSDPENSGEFEGDEFIARTPGKGKIIVTDARGKTAEIDIEVASSFTPRPHVPAGEEKRFIYQGPWRLVKNGVEETFAMIKEISTGKTYSRKTGEEIGGFLIKEFSSDELKLFDKKKNKEVILKRK